MVGLTKGVAATKKPALSSGDAVSEWYFLGFVPAVDAYTAFYMPVTHVSDSNHGGPECRVRHPTGRFKTNKDTVAQSRLSRLGSHTTH